MKTDLNELRQLCQAILARHGFLAEHQHGITETLLTAQQDDCHSHGVWRLLGVIDTWRQGKLAADVLPYISHEAGAVVKIDAGMGPAPTAFALGLPKLTDCARRFGVGILAINHCVHFSALWVEIEQLTRAGLVALNMTPSHAWVAPAGSTKPLLGTNPIGFGFPRDNAYEPYVFDFATSASARGEIQLRQRADEPLEAGWAIDAQGRPTLDATAALAGAMLTFGGHKGSALATMVELLAGPLIGDLSSQESMAFAEGTATLPYGGEIIIAIDPAFLLGEEADAHLARAEALLDQFNPAGARLPSQRRFQARQRNREQGGVVVDESVLAELRALLD